MCANVCSGTNLIVYEEPRESRGLECRDEEEEEHGNTWVLDSKGGPNTQRLANHAKEFYLPQPFMTWFPTFDHLYLAHFIYVRKFLIILG